jgi:predicted S18 family serine protease
MPSMFRSTLAALLAPLVFCAAPSDTDAFDKPRVASVPALAVRSDHTGVLHYIVIQIDRQTQKPGPLVQFSEITFGGGSVVGDDWKQGVNQAVLAALRQLGLDGKDWQVTIKNRSYNAMTEGMSASGAVAVGVMAAWRGDSLRKNAALTGKVAPDGRILEVASVPQKLEVAAKEGFTTVLVPRGQMQSAEWDLSPLAAKLRIDVIEVGTLEEAYQQMTGSGR